MSQDDTEPSLADRAAAWVPPWQRAAPPPEPVDMAAETVAETVDMAAETVAETVDPDASVGRDPAAVHEPQAVVAPPSVAPPVGAPAVADLVSENGLPHPTETGAAESDFAEPGPAGSTTGALGPGVGSDHSGPATAGPPTLRDLPAPREAGDRPVPEAAAEPVPMPEAAAEAVPEPGETSSARPAGLDPAHLRAALEAIMLVVDEPVADLTLAQVLEEATERVQAALAELAREYDQDGRGFALRRAAGGWRLYTRGEYAPYVERFVLDGQQTRLTQAALETLAVVAYKQPVTRSRISAIRGVNCDGVIKTLVARNLVEECGTEPDSGAFLYRTTTLFLEKLGIDSVGQLPPLAPFLPNNVDELDSVAG